MGQHDERTGETSSHDTAYRPKLTPFGDWVAGRVRLLAKGGRTPSGVNDPGYLRNGASATAAVAKLRHGIGHEIGDDSDLLAWVLPDADDAGIAGRDADDSGEPTPRERAAYASITLFAMHQQSIHDVSMHTDGYVTLGRAVGRMAYGNVNENGIRRLFDRLQTANGWKETVRHTRGMIQLLKRERIAINYGLLAQDLLGLRSGRERANRVRLRWCRDFQRGYGEAKSPSASAPSTPSA